MFQQSIKSNKLRFKDFYHGNVPDLIKEVRKWLAGQTINVYDITFFQGEDYVIAVVIFSTETS